MSVTEGVHIGRVAPCLQESYVALTILVNARLNGTAQRTAQILSFDVLWVTGDCLPLYINGQVQREIHFYGKRS
jgi:hypothetical protein